MPFEITGMANEIARIAALGDQAEPKAMRAVVVGAKYLVEKLKEAVPVDQGHLKAGIKAAKVEYDAANGYYSDVGPDGKDPITKEPLAKIGNIVEYGRSNMRPQPWFEPTLKREEAATLAIMQTEFDKDG